MSDIIILVLSQPHNIHLYSVRKTDRRTDNATQTSISILKGKKLNKSKLQHFKMKTTSNQTVHELTFPHLN